MKIARMSDKNGINWFALNEFKCQYNITDENLNDKT